MFIKSYKPTSPARRGVKIINNQLLCNFGKKHRPIRGWNLFKGKSVVKKSTNGPGRKYYKLYNKTPFRCWGTSITSTDKLTQVGYLKGLVETSPGVSFYVKSPGGSNLTHFYPQKQFLNNKHFIYLVGDRLRLISINSGGICYSIKVEGSNGWSIAEAAGVFCKILWNDSEYGYCALNLPSKKFTKLKSTDFANLGRVANKDQKRMAYMSAVSAKKKKNKRISVRGVAMNPVDHPNGGRSNTKQPLKNPWGRIAKKGK